jgi:glycosidase
MDTNGNGIGNFQGLTQRLDYLSGLGITCLWLLPFYPTPNRDNGYDVTDYCNVDPRLGTLGDFVEFMQQARERGIRVLIDFELVYSLLFTLPGTPLLRYGEEIGMGDDLSLHGRDSVRTPMQWTDQPNGGFSTAIPDALPRPVIAEGEYGYKRVNVESQQRDPNSLLNWMEHVIQIRKQLPELGYGQWKILSTNISSVFAHCCEWNGKTAIAVHNLTDRACVATLQDCKFENLIDLFGDCQYEPLDQNSDSIPLQAYGYRWFRVNQICHLI